MTERPQPAGSVAALLLLSMAFGVTVGRDVQYLFSSPYPYGVDGYYYLALLTRGEAPSAGLGGALPPIAILRLAAMIAGPVAAIKLCGMLFLLGGGAAAAILGARLSGSHFAGVLAFVLYTQGFMRVELLVNFLKQSMGQVWLLALLLLLAGLLPLGRRARIGGLALALTGALLSHTMAGVLGLLMAGAAGLYLLTQRRFSPAAAAALTALCTVAVLVPLTWLAARLAQAPDALWPAASQFLQRRPGLNLDLLRESLSSAPAFPRAGLLFLSALAALAALVRWPSHVSRAQGLALSAAAPIAMLALNPYLVPWTENPMGLHLRIVAALGIVLAVLVPIGIACLPLGRAGKGILFTAASLLFLAPPPHWAGHSGPPPDGGRLHEGMVQSAGRIPRDAIILTDLPRGNMVKALWGLPWEEARVASQERPQPNHYRLLFVSREDHVFYSTPIPGKPPVALIEIAAPWYLISEAAWREQPLPRAAER